MSSLHLVNKSPFERNTLEACLRLAVQGSAVLLFEDGVIAAMKNTTHSKKVMDAMDDFVFYTLGPDLKARGLNGGNVIDGIHVIDYDGFVDLATEYEKVQSWL